MKLTNAYIIDGDVIEKMIQEAKKERDNFFALKMFESAQRQQGMIDCFEVLLNEHLKPVFPIVEESFDSILENVELDYFQKIAVKTTKKDFLTKDF